MGDKLTSKLRIRIAEVEIDYEGPEAFLKEELPELLKTAMELHKAASSDLRSSTNGDGSRSEDDGAIAGTTGTIASALAVKSGTDLVLAAAAFLTFVEKAESFTRAQLHAAMKSATGYYHKNYGTNLSGYIKTALKDGHLSEPSKDVYALRPAARKMVEGQLANS